MTSRPLGPRRGSLLCALLLMGTSLPGMSLPGMRQRGAVQDAAGNAAGDATSKEPRRGAFPASFSELHPLAGVRSMVQRNRWKQSHIRKAEKEGSALNLADEVYQVYVPAAAPEGADERPFGLFVWISPTPSGRLPREWRQVLDAHHLIGIGADRGGNDRFVWQRVALALSAVHNLRQDYAIDPARIYASGFSGGGRVASRLGLLYPDVFTGGVYVGGCNFYRDIPVPNRPGHVWPARIPKPAASRWKLTRTRSRHVLLIGTADFNHAQSQFIAEQLAQEDGFAHAHLLEIEGAEHVLPDAWWLQQAIARLDAPLGED